MSRQDSALKRFCRCFHAWLPTSFLEVVFEAEMLEISRRQQEEVLQKLIEFIETQRLAEARKKFGAGVWVRE